MRVKFEIGVGSDCPHCKTGSINLKRSKYGEFFGCSRYPSCAFTQRIEEVQEIEEFTDYDDEDGDSGLVFSSKYAK